MKEPDYVRTTITVPTELKRRMIRKKVQPNWSKLAGDAFAAYVEEKNTLALTQQEIDTIAFLLENRARKPQHMSLSPLYAWVTINNERMIEDYEGWCKTQDIKPIIQRPPPHHHDEGCVQIEEWSLTRFLLSRISDQSNKRQQT